MSTANLQPLPDADPKEIYGTIPSSAAQTGIPRCDDAAFHAAAARVSSDCESANSNDDEGAAGIMFARGNVGILACYVGLSLIGNVMDAPFTVYLVRHLNASPTQQTAVGMISGLPWCLKFVSGIIADTHALGASHRTSYLVMGAGMHCFALLVTALLVSQELASVFALGLLGFVAQTGRMQMETMADALCVQLSHQHEDPANIGNKVAPVAFMARFGAGAVGSLLGAVLCNRESWGWGISYTELLMLAALFQLALLPWLVEIKEPPPPCSPAPLWIQLSQLWDLITMTAVARPLFAIWFVNMLTMPIPPWDSFLIQGLDFDSWNLGMLKLVGSVCGFVGVVVYKEQLQLVGWRLVFACGWFIGVMLGTMQLVLVSRLNVALGIPDFWFALGDRAASEIVWGITYTPYMAMLFVMCQQQEAAREAGTLGFLTTFLNLASPVSRLLGLGISKVWDTSNRAMVMQNFGGLWDVIAITSVISFLAIGLVIFLPNSSHEQKVLQGVSDRSGFNGFAFLLLFWGSLSLVLLETTWALLKSY